MRRTHEVVLKCLARRSDIFSIDPHLDPMRTALSPASEADRLAALERYALMDSANDPAYDAFTRLAAEICGTQVSLVSLIDSSRQWFKSNAGFPEVRETPREVAFCTHAIASGEYFEVNDTAADRRFADNPLVTGDPNIRFYAGVPLVDSEGFALGTLCTFDTRPQQLKEEQRYALQRLASSLVSLIESRKDVPERSLEQQAAFNAAFEFAADPVAILRVPKDRAGSAIISYVNRSFCDLFGFDPTALIGSGLAVLAGEKTDPVKMARLRAAARTFEPGTETTFLYASTGASRFVELRERVVDAAHRILSVRDLTRVLQTQEALSDANARLQSLLANNSDTVLTLGKDGECIDANAAAALLLGKSRSELRGRGLSHAIEGPIFPADTTFPDRVLRGETYAFPATYVLRDGRVIDVEAKVVPMTVRGVTEGAFLIFRDVTQARRLAERSEIHAKRTRSLYLIAAARGSTNPEQIDRALALVLEALDMQYGYVAKLVGNDLHVKNVVGDGVREVGEIVPLDQTRVADAIALDDVIAIDDIELDDVARVMVRKTVEYHAYVAAPLTIDGAVYGVIGFFAKRAMAFDGSDREFIRLVAALVASLVDRQISKQRLDDLAYNDSLTGLANRARLMQELESAVARVDRHGGTFALHYVDLDGFKGVNDRAGHATGDEVLVEAARRLGALHRPYDLPARLGGDEFVLIQAEAVTAEHASTLGDRIVRSLSEPYETSWGTMRIGASVGIAFYPSDAGSVEHLLQAADAALYRAKGRGKGQTALANGRYEPSVHA